MSWILTSEAREHELAGGAATHPDNLPSIREIAHSLAQINRYTGHASRPYSVAEHSLLVCMLAKADGAPTELVLATLMHDAHECITGDTSSPVKEALGAVWHEFEWMHQRHLLEMYELLDTFVQHKADIKKWDLVALATERRDLMCFDAALHRPWPVIDTPGRQHLPASVNLNTPQRRMNTWETWAWLFENEASLLMERRMAQQTGALA